MESSSVDCPCQSLFCVHNKLLIWIRDFNLHKLAHMVTLNSPSRVLMLTCFCCQAPCCRILPSLKLSRSKSLLISLLIFCFCGLLTKFLRLAESNTSLLEAGTGT